METTPQQPMTQPSYNNQANVPKNPFSHIGKGVTSLFKTNPVPVLIISLISTAVSVGFSLILVKIILSEAGSVPDIKYIVSIFGLFLGYILTTVILASVLNRTIVTGTRDQKITLGNAISICLSRLWLQVKFILYVGMYGLFGGLIVGLAAKLHPLAALLAGLVLFGLVLIYLIRWCFVMYIAVDDEKPANLRAMLQRSVQLLSKSKSAIGYLILLVFVAGMVAGVFTGGFKSETTQSTTTTSQVTYRNGRKITTTSEPQAKLGDVVVPVLIQSLLGTFGGLLIGAGMARIYNLAKQRS